MSQEKQTQVIFESSDVKIIREGDYELKKVVYPLKGYGNRYGNSIIVSGDVVEVWSFRDGWGGTGSKVIAEIHDKEFADCIKKAVVDVKNVDDFDKLVDLIERKQNEVNDYAIEKFDELVDRFVEISREIDKNRLIEKLLKDENRLRELAKEFLEEYIADQLEYY